MFPEAKLAVVNALKNDQQIVAMVGDGVNDGPALKAAHIGIAMGQKGTEIAKNAAALILVNDDLSRMIDAIATGRRIYANLKKAIQYIISIHIPIILAVSLPLFFGWLYPDIFTPVHVIFLELVMGPTCSIVYENEPMEKNTMQQPPRLMTETFLNARELSTSILQGLMISVGILLMYQLTVRQGGSEELTRTFVFTTLILANIFLTIVNRSFYFSFITTLSYKNNLLVSIIAVTLILLATILYIPPVTQFFHLVTRCVPRSPTIVSSFSGNRSMNSSAFAFRAASKISSTVAVGFP
jgi:Ca2+-transporting ATPase